MEEQFNAYREQYRRGWNATCEEINRAAAEARRISGILSKPDFAVAFWNYIPSCTREEIQKKEFSLQQAPDHIAYSDGHLYLSFGRLIGKYVRNIPYTCRYDGTLFIVDNPKRYDLYRKHLRDYGRTLQSIASGVQFQEAIYTGDRDSLWYQCCYDFQMPEDLTEKTAKELADKSFLRIRRATA